MEIRSVFIFSIYILIRVQGQVLDDLPDEFIIASDEFNVVLRMDINNNYSSVSIPFSNVFHAYDLDYDRTDGIIYWVNNKINSGSIFGMNIKTVRYLNVLAITYGIAVDSISRLLFYTDLGNHIIAAISLEDHSQKTVIISGLVSPRAIVIDPINGTIYWVDSGSPAKIETSNYDGTNRQEVVNTGLTTPYGLDVDINGGVLYWCDVNMFRIERANVDGSNQSIIYQEQLRTFGCSIALYQSYLYFTIWDYRTDIMRIGTDGSGLISIAPSALMRPQAIHVNHNGHIGSNGCSNGSGGCSHFCFPLPGGSNMCACPDVMTLQLDGKTCQIDDIPNNFLLAIDESKIFIYRMNIDNYSYVRIPIQNGYLPYAIEYDPNDAVMFWTDLNFWQINSGSIYGNNQTTLQGFKNYAVLKGIAVDHISRLLFYTDSGSNIIAVISLHNNLKKTVISDGLNTPQAIVTDPTKGIIYWSSLNKIEKSNYDGSNRQEVINTGLNAYVDLALEVNVGVMYWCHYSTRKIEVANVDGSNRQVLYQDPTSIYKCSIALRESYLYYIDSAQNVVMRIATDGSGMTSIGPSIFHNVADIHVHSNSSTIQGINGCSNGSGGCSHFCFPQPGGSKVCDCPDDMTLQPDGLSCGNYTLPENFLIIMDREYRDIYLLDIRNYRYVTIGLENFADPYAMTYDPIDRNIYWTDWGFRQIVSMSIYGDIRQTIRPLNIYGHAYGIALDALSRVIFYIDNIKQKIAALSLDGSMHKIVISYSNSSEYLWAIAIDPINGTIYWTAYEKNGKIGKSNYDGTNRQEVINSGLVTPKGLTIDIRAGVLYWCDSSTSMIERANVDGTNRQLIYQGQGARFDKIVLYQSHLYITGNERRWSLMRIGTDGSNLVRVGPSLFGYDSDICLHSNESGSLGPNGCSSRNGGCSHFCFPRPGSLKVCACPDGLTLLSDGHTCRSYDNVCDDQPCKNSAVCTNIDGSYLCNCSRGWQGQNCSADIDECIDNPCQNGGMCSNIDGSYLCNCSRGWQGQNCSSDIDECSANPCQNGGMCNNTDGSYLCNCSRGWQRQNCSDGILFAFGEDANDTVLKAKDDACGEPITILPIPIFGRKYDTLYVCTNGLVTFQREYTNPNPSADADAYSGYSFVAPYYTDFDTSRVDNSGKVYYQLYDVLRNKDLLNNTNVVKTQRRLQELNEEQSFKATMIFIATWYKNSPYPANKRSNESASFQLVLTTDGYKTFVMYIYFPGEMQFQQNNVFIGYHFNTGEFKRHLISFTSEATNIDMHVDTNGLTGLIVYRLTSQGSSLSNFDIQCLEWFEENQDQKDEYNRTIAEMPNCPCNSRWIMYDPWFSVPQQIFFNNVNTSCMGIAPSLKFSPHGKVCCFDNYTGGWLSDSPRAGGFLKFHPSTHKKEFESEDLQMRQLCCEKSNYCHLYYALRPVGDCYTNFPYEFALSWGDPHIKTLDSKTYTFNGWGEFTLISLRTENTSFILQGRTDKARSKNGTLSDATIFTAFAARDNNNASIHIEMSAERNGTYVYGNGLDYSKALADKESDFFVFTETLAIARAKGATTLNIVFPSTGQPISLNVTVGAEMLTLAVTLPPIFKNKTKGLLGNYDGDPNNDFINPNGTVLDGNATERTLFNYGISWSIDDSESVFIYPRGKSHADFDHRNFTPKFSDEATPEQLKAAKGLCDRNAECTYDFIMTSSELVAANTKTVQEKADNRTKEVSNQIPSLSFVGKRNLNVTDDQTVNLKFNATDDGPVTFRIETNTVDAKFVYIDDKTAEVNFTLGSRDNQCELSVTAIDEQGYFAPPVRLDLIICDGCSGHGRCDLNTIQTDTETCSFRKVKCICDPYWEGSSCQLDFDGCRGSPCSLNRSCTDLNAYDHKKTGVAFNCSQCPQGYLKDGNKCLDIDECNETSDGCNQKCVNTMGSFSCECDAGFALSTDGRTCEDIDECERHLDNCEQICTNGVGNFTCGCFPGFTYNASMNVCIRTAVPDVCDRPAIDCNQTAGCTSINGTARCFCQKGFQLSNEGTTCVDSDECISSPCSQICHNFYGGFSCHCLQGYELEKDSRTCIECKYPKYGNYCQEICNCGSHGVQCHPVKGCKCESGWEGKECQQDIDECTQSPNICNDPYSLCKNLAGTYTCQCVDGFKKNDSGRCQDIDECSDPYWNKCSQLCSNTLRGFTCGCEKGYQLDQNDQYKCIDVDECKIGTSGCEQICENTPGLYNCYCEYGYKLRTDRKKCEKETDVCAKLGNINCSQICLVVNGKPACACQQGYVLDTDGKICKDINECEKNTCSQPGNCVNMNGSFSCYCNDGYWLDNDGITCRECDKFHYGRNCNNTCNCGIGAVTCDKLKGCICKPGWQEPSCETDVNECLLNNSLCPGKHQMCINTAGSYLCNCHTGYIRDSNSSVDCKDLNECDDPVLNICDQNCTNTDGSYSCTCNEGFIWQDKRCVDVNECELSNTCQHICDNLQGSYRCLCYTGFKVDVDNTTKCKPITECPRNETEFCAAKRAQCAISRGNAVCPCSKGFEWNSEQKDCIDIIDCNVNARCNQQCIEEIGGYTCACWNGYRLLENNVTCVACGNNTYAAGCSEICPCVHNNAVNETQTCDHVNGTCICKPGWEGRCDRDIDECTRNTQMICRGIPNSGCHNTIGGYECSCLRGYALQGNQCITDGTSPSTPAPEAGETVVVMSVKLDVALENGVNLNVTATYEYFSNAAKIALEEFYRQRMMDKLKRIEIISLVSGSLVIEFDVTIDSTQDAAAIFTLTNVEMASGASVMFENKSTGILDVRVSGTKVSPKPSDEELCKLYQLIFATCNNGYMCKVTYGLPSCRQIEKYEYYLTTALAAGIPVGLLLTGAIIVLICVIKRRARTDRKAQDNSSGNLYERTSTTEPVVNRLDTISTEKTYAQIGSTSSGIYDICEYDSDDKSTGTPWQIRAVGLFPNETFRIKRPRLEQHPKRI